MPTSACPTCGVPVQPGAITCPLCRSRVANVSLRRVALWATVLAEYLLIAVFYVLT